MSTLAERVGEVRERVADAARRSGRQPDAVTVVAVSKTRPAADINAAAKLGLRHFGENRVPEAAGKLPQVEADITAHLIGHLQGNKARVAVGLFPVIQSVDSVRLGARLNRLAAQAGTSLDVFAQVDLAGEAAKSGLPEAELPSALEELGRMEALLLRGLMIIPPFAPDPEAARPWFARLRALGEACAARGLLPEAPELSMGMSGDYPVAIGEGATMVRVGTAIFGPRGDC